jgi:hypothetical protein
MDTRNIAIEIIGIPLLIMGILTIFTEWSFIQILAISLACGLIIVVIDLTRMKSAEILSEPTDKQPATPTRKIPAKKVIEVIAVIVIAGLIIGLFFGNIGNIVDKIKGAPETKETINLTLTYEDNYSDPGKIGNYLLSETEGASGYYLNRKFIIKIATKTNYILRQTFASDNIGIKFTVRKIFGDGQSAFGCSIEDGASRYPKYPLNIYDGTTQILLKPEDGSIYHGGMETGKLYTVEVTRTVENRGFLFKSEDVYLSFKVNGESIEINYPLPLKEEKKISLYFISENSSKFEIDYLAIYTAA